MASVTRLEHAQKVVYLFVFCSTQLNEILKKKKNNNNLVLKIKHGWKENSQMIIKMSHYGPVYFFEHFYFFE